MTGMARGVREKTGFNKIAQLFEMQESFPLKPIRLWLLHMTAEAQCKVSIPDKAKLTL